MSGTFVCRFACCLATEQNDIGALNGSYGVSHLRSAQNRINRPPRTPVMRREMSATKKVRRLRVTRLYASRVHYKNECARPFERVIRGYLIDSRSTAAMVAICLSAVNLLDRSP